MKRKTVDFLYKQEVTAKISLAKYRGRVGGVLISSLFVEFDR